MVALGVASGIFIVPILTIIAEVDVRVAIGTSLVSVIAYYSGKRCTVPQAASHERAAGDPVGGSGSVALELSRSGPDEFRELAEEDI